MPAAQRRETILAAAETVFAQRGYHGASLDDIAHAATISKALIYEHFASKRELHASLVDAYVSEIFARLQANAALDTRGEERLRGGLHAFFSFVEEHRGAWRALFRDAADPEVTERLARVQDQAAGVVAVLMAADHDDADELSIRMHAQLLFGAVQALANWWHDHQEVSRDVVVDHAVEFCWVGMQRLSQGSALGLSSPAP